MEAYYDQRDKDDEIRAGVVDAFEEELKKNEDPTGNTKWVSRANSNRATYNTRNPDWEAN